MTPGLRLLGALLTLVAALPARADDAAWSALRERGAVLLLRHAQTDPGVGDPPGFSLDDCATQRNLSTAGRAQAVAGGRRLAERGIKVGRVESSRWCRCVETARLAFPDHEVHANAALNSFFGERGTEARQTAALRERVRQWRGPGTLVLVTHQVNITALTGRPVAMGEALVLLADASGERVIGSLPF